MSRPRGAGETAAGGEGRGAVGAAPGTPVPGRVARIIPFSAVDGPGNRAVVFLQGCDFDCAYCHNPETRGRGGAEIETLTAGEVMERVGRYRAFLRGITVSGGECLLQADFLAELLEASRDIGLPGLVDTNGSSDLAGLPRILEAAEGFMLDVKAWKADEHRALVGADNAVVLRNLRLLAPTPKLTEVRTVVSPGAFDLETTVRETSKLLAAAGSKAVYKLLRYRPIGVRPEKLAALAQPDDALMQRLVELARSLGARAEAGA